MLSLEPVIVARLREVLSLPWFVVGDTTDKGDRRARPLALVSFADGNLADRKAGAVSVQPAWRITLAAKRGDDAAALIDAAFAAAIGALHNWMPGAVAGRGWQRMELLRFMAPQYVEDGLTGVELFFTTSARYDGQD